MIFQISCSDEYDWSYVVTYYRSKWNDTPLYVMASIDHDVRFICLNRLQYHLLNILANILIRQLSTLPYLAMRRVEIHGPKKKERKQMNQTKKCTNLSVPHCALMNRSTRNYKLVDVIAAVYQSDCRISDKFSDKTVHYSYAVPPMKYDKIHYSHHVHCSCSFNYEVTCQTIHGSAYSSSNSSSWAGTWQYSSFTVTQAQK